MSYMKLGVSIVAACSFAFVLGACGVNASEPPATQTQSHPVELTQYSDAASLNNGAAVVVSSGNLRLSGDNDAKLCLKGTDSMPPVCTEETFTLRGVDSSMKLTWEWQDPGTNPVERSTVVALKGRLVAPGVIQVDSIENSPNLVTPSVAPTGQ